MRKGQLFPMGRWFTGMILIVIIYVMYGATSGVVESILPDAYNAQSFATANGALNVELIKNNFVVGVTILFGGVFFFMVLSGIPFQREDIVT